MGTIVQHPGAENTPLMTIANAVSLAQDGVMVDCCLMFSDRDGQMHIAWSKMSDADLAAYAVVLSHLAATRLAEPS